MVSLAGERTSGALTYFMPPEHTALARNDISSTNPAANLAVEQMVVLETDTTKSRAIAIAGMTRYLRLPNYTNSLKRVGFTDADIDSGNGEPSSRLIDAVVVCGDEATIHKRVAEHHAAGANHVCIQVLTDTPQVVPMTQWNRLADALL
jgi:probable F420-dependent oxidoreductase